MRTIPTVALQLRDNDFPELLEVRGEVYMPKAGFAQLNATALNNKEKTFAIRAMLRLAA